MVGIEMCLVISAVTGGLTSSKTIAKAPAPANAVASVSSDSVQGRFAFDVITAFLAHTDATALAGAGAFAIVLELVNPPVTAEITKHISIPTIGIGSGPDCDGQILVTNDLLALFRGSRRNLSKPRLDAARLTRAAVQDWVKSIGAATEMTNDQATHHLDARGEASMVMYPLNAFRIAKPSPQGNPPARRNDSLDSVDQIAKGNVLAAARLPEFMAAKRTGELIPLCHPLPITHCEVALNSEKRRPHLITASAKITANGS